MNLKEKVKSFPAWFKKTQKKNKLKVVVGTLVVIVILSKVMGGDKEKIEYEYIKVEKGNIESLYSETGEIQNSNVTEVVSTIEGVVGEVYVANGAIIYRGQNLFYVTSTANAQERALAYSNYLTAKNALETAERNKWTYESDMWEAHETFEADALDPDKPEVDPIYIQTQRDWLAAEKNYLDQEQVIAQAKASVSNTWLKYQAMIDGIVRSPSSGTVANLAVATGQQVSIVDPVLLVEQVADVWVKIQVNEVNILKIELGQPAEMVLDSRSDKTYVGEVRRVDQVGTLDQGVVVYSVYLVINDADEKILPAMTVSVDIQLEKKEDVLIVPNKAVKVYQGDKAVQVMDKKTDQVIYLPIQVGTRGLVNTEVVLGLKEGQEIIVEEKNNNDSSRQSRGMFGPR